MRRKLFVCGQSKEWFSLAGRMRKRKQHLRWLLLSLNVALNQNFRNVFASIILP